MAQPSDWEKEVRKATSSDSVTAKEIVQRKVWKFALERIRAEHSGWTRGRTDSGPWVDTPLGSPDVGISMYWYETGLVVQLYFTSPDAALNAKRYGRLLARRDDFEAALDDTPQWEPMEGRKA